MQLSFGFPECTNLELPNLRRIRSQLLSLSGFDLFDSHDFIEKLVCNICHLEQSYHCCPWDGITASGIKVEIKHSNLTERTQGNYRFFAWHKLQGSSGKGKGADVFVCVGHAGDDLLFLTIPASHVGDSNQITYTLSGASDSWRLLSGRWAVYRTEMRDLSEAIERANGFNTVDTSNVTRIEAASLLRQGSL